MAGKRQRQETEALQYKAHIASMEVMKMWLSKSDPEGRLSDLMPPSRQSLSAEARHGSDEEDEWMPEMNT